MATTIQTIETPKRARALDTSSGWQAVSGELFTTADGTSIVNEANGFAAWTAMAGTSVAVRAMVSSNTYHGDYAVQYTPHGSEGNGDGIRMDLNTYCTVGKTYEISIWGKHANDGTADNLHYIRLSGASDLGAGDTRTVNLTNPQTGREAFQEGESADIAWSERFIRFTHSADTRYFGARESGTSNDGSLILDSLSIKEVKYFPNNNHGQIYSGRGLEFDGVTDYLDTPIKFDSTNFTFAAWIKANDDSVNKVIIDCRDGDNDGIMLQCTTAETIKLGLNAVDTTGSAIVANKWARVVATYDGSTVNIYINGVLDVTASVSQTFSADTKTLRIGRKAYGASNYFDGLMSDVQVWTTAWTADDVSYDYLNPESIVLNRGGTSLTNSNLKLWYPMQDGHRGQQSHVLDASNTGLGDNLVTNGDFDTDSNWSGAGTSWSISNGKASSDGSVAGNNYLIHSSTTAVIGKTYKVEFTVSDYVQGTVKVRAGQATGVLVSANGNYTQYMVAEATEICRLHAASNFIGKVDNVSVKAVNNKNNATTVFYGDEMWDANDHTVGWNGRQHIIETTDREFAAASSWVAYGTGTTLGDDGSPTHLEVTGTSSTSAQGVQLSGRRHKRWIKGQQYRISANIWWNDGSSPGIGSVFYFKLGGATSSSFEVTATSRGTAYTADITAINNTGSILIYYTNASTEQWNVDDVSVVQIGTPIGGTNDGVSLPYVGHTASHGAYIHLSDAEKLNSDLTIGRKYRLSGLFATDVAGTVNAPEVAVLTNAEDTWYYDATQSTVPATNLIQNPGFETAGSGGADIWANWTEVAGSGTLANDTSNEHNGDDCASLTTVSTNTCNIHQSVTVTAGTTYLVSYWSKSGHASDSGSLRHRVLNASDSDSVIVDSTYSGNTTTDWRQTVFQFTAPTGCTSAKLVLMSPASNYTALADDVLVTAFLEKNIDFTASTTDSDYLAHKNKAMSDTDCMIYRKASSYINQDFTGVSTNWIAYNISSITLDTSNDNLDFTTTSDNEKEGASLDVGYFEPLEIGRWYTVVVTLSSASGSPTVYVDVGGAESHGRVISTTPTEYAFTVGPVSSVTGTLKVYTEETDGYTITMDDVQLFENCTLYYDDISLKEIGTASGWTDADQQLHIPQTALQSYNELAWFDGSQRTTHDNGFTPGDNTTVAFWVFLNGPDGENKGLFNCISWNSDNFRIIVDPSNRIAVQIASSGVTTTYTDSKTTITKGKWIHVCATIPKATSSTGTIYINGEGENYTTSTTMATASRNINFLYGGGLTQEYVPGSITEMSIWNAILTQAEVQELYNDGKALDALIHSNTSNLTAYWRNNGLNTWTDLKGSDDGTMTCDETMLIPQGLDNRDSQGFIMNRQRNTSSLNFINKAGLATNANDRVEVLPFTDLIADGATAASLECWVKANGTGGSDDYCTFAGERTSKNILLCGRTATSRPEAVYRLTTGGNSNSVGGDILQSTSVNIFDGDWHHMVFTFQSDDRKGRLYVDGSLHDTTTSDHSGDTLDNDHALFYVGGGDGGQARNFNGMVDGVRVYSNSLSLAEVKRNYNATKGNHRN